MPSPNGAQSRQFTEPLEALGATVSGRRIILRGDRTAYLPESRTLLLADLHLGKAEALQVQGIALPRGSEDGDLGRLSAAVAECQPDSVVILGDLFHDPRALNPERRKRLLDSLTAASGVPLTVVLGNHDRLSPEDAEGFRIMIEATPLPFDGFRLQHHPPEAGDTSVIDEPTIAGHLHPVTRVTAPGERLRLPCFLVNQRGVVLPAFGSVTGGTLFTRKAGFRRYGLFNGVLLALDGPEE